MAPSGGDACMGGCRRDAELWIGPHQWMPQSSARHSSLGGQHGRPASPTHHQRQASASVAARWLAADPTLSIMSYTLLSHATLHSPVTHAELPPHNCASLA